MKKAFILAAALCSAAACSNNQAVTMNENGKEIITDGFRVVSADESFPAEDLLGPLGDKKVVRGRKDPSHRIPPSSGWASRNLSPSPTDRDSVSQKDPGKAGTLW